MFGGERALVRGAGASAFCFPPQTIRPHEAPVLVEEGLGKRSLWTKSNLRPKSDISKVTYTSKHHTGQLRLLSKSMTAMPMDVQFFPIVTMAQFPSHIYIKIIQHHGRGRCKAYNVYLHMSILHSHVYSTFHMSTLHPHVYSTSTCLFYTHMPTPHAHVYSTLTCLLHMHMSTLHPHVYSTLTCLLKKCLLYTHMSTQKNNIRARKYSRRIYSLEYMLTVIIFVYKTHTIHPFGTCN